MSFVEKLEHSVLKRLYVDFKNRGLKTADLGSGYAGVPLRIFKETWPSKEVDLDLAVKNLESKGLVKSGPEVLHENEPGSGIMFLGTYNKREHLCLTEKGYQSAQMGKVPKSKASSQHVSIRDSHFYHSPVGVGGAVSQSVAVNVESDTEVASYLIKLLESQKAPLTDEVRKDVPEIVRLAKAGDMNKAKPLFQKTFGFLAEGAKQIAWGVIVNIISKQFGIQ